MLGKGSKKNLDENISGEYAIKKTFFTGGGWVSAPNNLVWPFFFSFSEPFPYDVPMGHYYFLIT